MAGQAAGPAPTLEELLLPTGQGLEISCCWHACRRQAYWTAEQALARLGAACTIVQAQRRLSCTACGHRGRDGEVRCRPSVRDFYARRAVAWEAERRAQNAKKPQDGDPGAS